MRKSAGLVRSSKMLMYLSRFFFFGRMWGVVQSVCDTFISRGLLCRGCGCYRRGEVKEDEEKSLLYRYL